MRKHLNRLAALHAGRSALIKRKHCIYTVLHVMRQSCESHCMTPVLKNTVLAAEDCQR